ncbi:MAG TPA: DUF4337 family protein [Polyangia bacterium]|nr:DUF4337 family protein [Polyangia bacterium]
MPEEDIETGELKEQLHHTVEHGQGGPRWTQVLSVSTALLAVLAAVASLLSGAYSNDALLAKNDGVLQQAKASDAWSYFQAKGTRAAVYAVQADGLAKSEPAAAARMRQEADRYRDEQKEIQQQARELEKKVQEDDERAERLLERHHQFARAVTFSQIAIALAAIAALMKKKWLWFVGLGSGAVGVVFLIRGLAGAG